MKNTSHLNSRNLEVYPFYETEGGHLVISLCMFSPSFCDMIPYYAHIFRYLQNK